MFSLFVRSKLKIKVVIKEVHLIFSFYFLSESLCQFDGAQIWEIGERESQKWIEAKCSSFDSPVKV